MLGAHTYDVNGINALFPLNWPRYLLLVLLSLLQNFFPDAP